MTFPITYDDIKTLAVKLAQLRRLEGSEGPK